MRSGLRSYCFLELRTFVDSGRGTGDGGIEADGVQVASICITIGPRSLPWMKTWRGEGRPWHNAFLGPRSGEKHFGRSNVFLLDGINSKMAGIVAPLRPCGERFAF